MTIEKIAYRDKDSVIVYLDNKEKLLLSLDTLIKRTLCKGKEISAEELNSLREENAKYSASLTALRLLARRGHSIGELRDKLRQRKFNKQIIDSVIQELSESGYLNDLDFAYKFSSELLNYRNLGENAIKMELIKKKIPRQIIDTVISEFITDDKEKENIIILAKKKFSIISKSEVSKKKIKIKLYNYLTSKGYKTELIIETINSIISYDEDDDSEFN